LKTKSVNIPPSWWKREGLLCRRDHVQWPRPR